MALTKDEVQKELMVFMQGFAQSVERVYGGGVVEVLSNEDQIKKSWLWRSVDQMYDFGIAGLPVEGLGVGTLDGTLSDAENFLRSLKSMELYLDEDDVSLPRLSLRTVQTAIARHVLEGGERDIDYGVAEYGDGNGDYEYLTLMEVALLADMDERSVRNATSSKIPDALQTVKIGKRALVTTEEAKRWLADRKAFVPTKLTRPDPCEATHEIVLPTDIAQRLTEKAKESGLSVAEFIAQRIA